MRELIPPAETSRSIGLVDSNRGEARKAAINKWRDRRGCRERGVFLSCCDRKKTLVSTVTITIAIVNQLGGGAPRRRRVLVAGGFAVGRPV